MLKAEKLGFAYRPEEWLLRDLSFSIDDGEVLGVLGPNGNGKTTLLRCLMGVLTPQEGGCLTEADTAYVPQASSTEHPYQVLEMTVMGRASKMGFFSMPTATDYKIAEQALAAMHIADLAQRQYCTLSGGQRQLVLIARALASGARYLIMDEPVSALDLRNQNRVLGLMKELSRQGISIVFSSHNPQHVYATAHKALLLFSAGDSVCGMADAVMTEANLSRLYGVKVRYATFSDDGHEQKTIVPVF